MDNHTLETQIEKIEEKVKLSSLPDDPHEKVIEELSVFRIALKSPNFSFINFESFSNYVTWTLSFSQRY